MNKYKYLGILFTRDLSFDQHVLKVSLPKARKVAGHVSHLLKNCKTGRATFLRVLWRGKISPILEYGAGVWSSFVSQNTLDTIDKFQKEYFRKAMGLPRGTCSSALLCDIAVVRQSLRFQTARMKLRAQLELKLVPDIVMRQHAAYCSTRVVKTKYFIAATRRECLELRDFWLTRHKRDVVVPKSESFSQYRSSLMEHKPNSRIQYRGLYRNDSCKTRPWRATLRVWACPEFPSVPGKINNSPSTYDMIRDLISKHLDQSKDHMIPAKVLFKYFFSKVAHAVNNSTQWNDFETNFPNHILHSFRKGWYFDPLLTGIRDPYMRLIRKARLGVSELASHTHYMCQSKSKACTHCDSGSHETLHHFFFECSAYDSQRAKFLNTVRPILSELGLPFDQVWPLLGFPRGAASKRYFHTHKHLREQLYSETCDFMRKTSRFRFV